MNYKLEFVKISDQHEFAGVGFAGNIFIVLNALSFISTEDNMYVDMESNECVCTQPDLDLFDTKNSWEYYFVQKNLGDSYITWNSLKEANIQYENRDMFMNPNNFLDLKDKFYKNFKLKEGIQNLVNDYYTNNIKGKITLGVQIRLTDMKHYHGVSGLDAYLAKIKEILTQNPNIEQIFLATDDGTIIEKVKENVSIPVIYHTDMFRADEKNPHIHPYDRFKNERKFHRYFLGVECIQEIFALTKCDYMLKADVSSISIIACILSDNIKQIYKL